MEKFILGKKVEMTQLFDEQGTVIPVTVIEAGPEQVTQVKTRDIDGYQAVQVEFKKKRREFKADKSFEKGASISVSVFQPGDVVKVSGITKGRGFQGVMKRHGFHGAPATHGTKHAHREPGSIGGAGRAGGRVAKGMRMAGRMGSDRVTVRNLKIAKVDLENNMLAIKGAIPGRRGTLLEIRG